MSLSASAAGCATTTSSTRGARPRSARSTSPTRRVASSPRPSRITASEAPAMPTPAKITWWPSRYISCAGASRFLNFSWQLAGVRGAHELADLGRQRRHRHHEILRGLDEQLRPVALLAEHEPLEVRPDHRHRVERRIELGAQAHEQQQRALEDDDLLRHVEVLATARAARCPCGGGRRRSRGPSADRT